MPRFLRPLPPQLPRIAQAVEWAIEAIGVWRENVLHGCRNQRPVSVYWMRRNVPHLGVSPDLIVGLIAGGEQAFIKAVEGAEDSRELGAEDLRSRHLTSKDLVVGIAASGRTPTSWVAWSWPGRKVAGP